MDGLLFRAAVPNPDVYHVLQCISDAAVALAYLGARGNRRWAPQPESYDLSSVGSGRSTNLLRTRVMLACDRIGAGQWSSVQQLLNTRVRT